MFLDNDELAIIRSIFMKVKFIHIYDAHVENKINISFRQYMTRREGREKF